MVMEIINETAANSQMGAVDFFWEGERDMIIDER